MGKNQPSKEVIDTELENAKRSMGSRIDQDDVTPPIVQEEKPVITPEATPVVGKDEKPADPIVKKEDEQLPDLKVPEDDNKAPNRPKAFIPIPQYLDEKKVWESDKARAEAAEKRLAELEALGNQKKPANEDQIQDFAEKHMMDPDMVKDLLGMVESKVLPGDMRKQLDDALKITDQKKYEEKVLASQESFKNEFKDVGLPEINKLYPSATPEQLEAARIFLDGAAHTPTFHDKELPYVIYKLGGELNKIFTGSDKPADTPNKGMEQHKTGQARVGTPTADDWKGKTDFADFLQLDQGVQDQIRKEMDNTTYQKLIHFVGKQNQGVEVMRDGRKVILK